MKKSIFTSIISFSLLLAAIPISFAQAGSLDISFGNGGKVTTAFPGPDYANSVAIQSDGKMVVAGCSGMAYTSVFSLLRYNSNGNLDNSFGIGGKVTTYFGSYLDICNAVAIQSDGKIIVAGFSTNGSNLDFALARYHSDGSLDNSFGIGGKVTTDFVGDDDAANAIIIQSDGKIVVAGYSYGNTYNDFALVRYNLDGSLDNSFGTGGKVTTDFGNSFDYAYSIAIQSDGKIVAAGKGDGFALARYNNNGTLDNSFGSSGKITTNFTWHGAGYTIDIQSDGKIVVAGEISEPTLTNSDFALVRYNVDGSLDVNFGIGGKVFTDFVGNNDYGYSVVIQIDGKIIVAGKGIDSTYHSDIVLARYKSDGSLDNGFGIGGKVTTSDYNAAYSVSLQSDGKIVVVGFGKNDFAAVRYLSDGSLDNSFGIGGKVNTDFEISGNDGASSVVIQSNGKMVVAGYFNHDQFALARYEINGALDNSFGIGGKVTGG